MRESCRLGTISTLAIDRTAPDAAEAISVASVFLWVTRNSNAKFRSLYGPKTTKDRLPRGDGFASTALRGIWLLRFCWLERRCEFPGMSPGSLASDPLTAGNETIR